jgi:hypothetical protein
MKSGSLADIKFNKKVLLTGAGFTKDFGGYLAGEMWSFIFNSRSLNSYPRIKDLLRDDFSYESVYHEVIEGNEYETAEREAIKAVVVAYDRLNENIIGYMQRKVSGTAKANSVSLSAFIDEFRGGSNETGFFFTLNQDMFVEMHCRYNGPIPTPGIPLQDISYTGLSQSAIQRMPDEKTLFNDNGDLRTNSLKSSKFNYIKLHGSYHWRDSDGNNCMVIGKKKTEEISKEPLLKYYSDLFEEVLSSGGAELFVIGYGFADSI